MSNLFPNLFSPLDLRGKRLKNRLFLAAHGTGYAENGTVGDQGLAYYEARVTRGISLLITEAMQVVSIAGQKYPTLSAATDECIPRLKRLADLCHDHDCLFFGQLFHEGRARGHSMDGSKDLTVGPSPLPDERHHNMPRPMTVAMIRDFVESFAAGAARVERAGADGVELLVGMGYLHSQFLNPKVNIRKDQYGGTPENRLRFLHETLQAMRAAVSDDFIVGIRIAGEEYDPDGLQMADTIHACRTLEADGLIDYVNVCAAGTHTLAGTSYIVPPMFVETGQSLPFAETVRRELKVPIFTCGRINQPQEAERAVASGQTDMVGMVRALIADPAFVEKAAAGRPDDIRACIACNQACIGHRSMGHGVSCIQYPETGRERDYGTKAKVAKAKRVLVVGGGPGGMKAAVVAAERGHDVTLYERSSRLGGQALLAQALPGRAEFGGLVTNLEREVELNGVAVVRNTALTADDVLAQAPDAVVVATGATPYQPLGAFEGAHMVTAWDVINGTANVGSRVVIADWRCDWVGMGVAEMLAANGCGVRLCVNGEMAGQSLQIYLRYMWASRLQRLGVEVVPYTRLFGADEDAVYMQHIVSGDPIECVGVDTLVLAYGHKSEASLLDELDGKIEVLHGIGDCLSPRTAEEAVLEGLRVSASL